MISVTKLQSMYGALSQNNTDENLALGLQIMNQEQRYLLQKFFSNEGSFTDKTVAQQQYYKAPPNYSKLKTITITIGNLTWTLTEILTRQEWDRLNVFPYYSDIPVNYFIYPAGDRGVKIGIWPIPSNSDNTITFNYKYRIPDLSLADYTTGTLSVTTNTTAVTGSGTTWTTTANTGLESRWLQISPTKGDNLWYQIASVNSATSLTLYAPYQGITVSSGTYTIGQMPILMEDFHDMLVYKALVFYFSSIVDNPQKATEYQNQYNLKLDMLNQYAGTTSIDVNLRHKPLSRNPNLYQQNIN